MSIRNGWAWLFVYFVGVFAACTNRTRSFETTDGAAAPDGDDPWMDVTTPSSDSNTEGTDSGGEVPHDAGPLPPSVTIVVPGTPADAPMQFSGSEDPSRAPEIVYPSDGTIVPPNLVGLEVHYRPGAGNDLFEVSFAGASSTVRIYTRCNAVSDGCVLSLEPSVFSQIARAGQVDGRVRIEVRGTRAGAGGRFGRSAAHSLGIADHDIRGGLYYWAAGSGNIMRYEFGLPGARAEVYMRGGDSFNCLGCHSLSRDGRRIAVGRSIPGPSYMRTYDVMTRSAVGNEYRANFATFSPDNTKLLISDGVQLVLLDAETGNSTSGLPPRFSGTMPDWSPDGRQVVFARPYSSPPPLAGTPGHSGPSDLLVMPWTGTAFGTATTLVSAGGQNNYYPSFSPDGAWVLFNRSSSESYNAIDAHVWAVRADGSAAPVRLANADGIGDLGNSWPKWAPFVQTYRGEPLMWFTVSSRRDYGLRLQQQSRPAEERRAQLWMAAFLPSRAAMGDPSAPAFWLPFQSLSEGNHIAQWTQQVRRQSCTRDSDCMSGEVCLILSAGGLCVGR